MAETSAILLFRLAAQALVAAQQRPALDFLPASIVSDEEFTLLPLLLPDQL